VIDGGQQEGATPVWVMVGWGSGQHAPIVERMRQNATIAGESDPCHSATEWMNLVVHDKDTPIHH